MYHYLDSSLLPKHLQAKPKPAPSGIPDKVRPLRKFAMGLGIKRPYLYNKVTLTQLVTEKMKNG